MAGHLIRRLHQQSTQVFQARMQALGVDLTSVQFAALDAIHQHPGIDQAGLAAVIGYDRATIGGVVDRLETKEVVQRVTKPGDRRARALSLSPRGKDLLTLIRPEVIAVQADILSRLTEAEQDLFRTLARKALALGDTDQPDQRA